MAKTFNRAPLQVNLPSSSDVKNYFFNHYNWKGVNRDKNVLTVDQETFADAKNIYIDGEGILRSRPSIKKILLEGYEKNAKILDVQPFDDIDLVIVYLPDMNHTTVNAYRCNDYVTSFVMGSGEISTDSFKLLYANNIVYVFSETSLFGYDIKNNIRLNPSDCVYVPNTVVDANGVKTKVESKNILTDKEVITYLYQRDLGISIEAYGKELSVTIDDVRYSLVFDVDTPYSLVKKKFDIPSNYDYVAVSSVGSFLCYDSVSGDITYSAEGSIFKKIGTIKSEYGDLVVKPKFSQDGNVIFFATIKSNTARVYAITVNRDGGITYELITDVGNYLNKSFHYDYEIPGEVFVDFADGSNFAVVVRVSTPDPDGNILISSTLSVYENGSFYTKTLGRISEYTNRLVGINFKYNPTLKHKFLYIDKDLTGYVLHLSDGNMNAFHVDLSEELQYFEHWDIVDLISNYESFKILILDDLGYYYRAKVYDDCTMSKFTGFAKQIRDSSGTGKLTYDGEFLITQHEIVNFSKYTSRLNLIPGLTPLMAIDCFYYIKDGSVYSNNFTDTLEFKYYATAEYNYIKPSTISRLSAYYFAKDSTLYIGNLVDDDGVFKLYLPYENRHEFDGDITNIQPINTTSVSVFLNNSLYYVDQVDNAYTVTKSKLTFGLSKHGDVITSYEGDRVFFCTDRGFVALSYQDFVASTDQTITVLSDFIHDEMNEYCKEPVKLFKYDFWIILYKTNSSKSFVFDTRNGSWWPIDSNKIIQKVFKFKKKLYLLSDKVYLLDTSHTDYYDFDDKETSIEWYATSQKLHLSAINYYKHIVNITLSSITDNVNELTFNLDIINYRRDVDVAKTQQLRYNVKTIRTFVKRLNYSKVTEFQYTLSSDNDNSIQLPLSVSDITIKYKITGQVR